LSSAIGQYQRRFRRLRGVNPYRMPAGNAEKVPRVWC
jgi:hypothetical protein